MVGFMSVRDKRAVLRRLRSMDESEHAVGVYADHVDGRDGFCGLGVCLDELGGGEWVYVPFDGVSPKDSKRGFWEYCDRDGRDECGVLKGLGFGWRVQDTVTFMNDSERRTFAEIADYLDGVL